ncbi:MAG: BrnA antitoxin family protein [Patescibacteria group bacterium]
MKKPLKLPKFKNEDEEREFWDKIDLTDYFEAKDFIRASFPNLRPTSKSISLRMPQTVLWDLKQRANAIDIPYQALMKKYIAEGMKRDSQLVKK